MCVCVCVMVACVVKEESHYMRLRDRCHVPWRHHVRRSVRQTEVAMVTNTAERRQMQSVAHDSRTFGTHWTNPHTVVV